MKSSLMKYYNWITGGLLLCKEFVNDSQTQRFYVLLLK